MKKLIFKLLSITLILTHLSAVCLKDVSFAQETPQPASGDSQQAPPSSVESQTDSSPKETPPLRLRTDSGPIPPPQLMGIHGFNLATLQSFQADPFTGKATFSIPIVVPQGRRGLQPNLTLTYGSGSGNGLLGVGWSLELGSIERSTKKGPPKYDSSDTFVFNSGGSSQELVNISGSEYRAKIEGGFLKFTFNGSSWTVTDKSGSKYYFGQTSGSRQEDNSRISKWCLDKALDTSGNYLTLTYTKDQNQLYPQEIQYTGNENTSLAPCSKVEFVLEERPDIVLSYRSGFRVVTAKRLSDIKVSANGQLLRRYHLGFILSNTNRSLLTSVTQYASDDSTALPAVTFEYQQQNIGWKLATTTVPDTYGAFDWTTLLLDVNNDGFVDIISNNGSNAYLGRKDGTWKATSEWKLPGGISDAYGDCGWRFNDLNGDGWVDAILYNYVFRCGRWTGCGDPDGRSRRNVYINNKTNGWIYDATWSSRVPSGMHFISWAYYADSSKYVSGFVLADINGDGLVDILRASLEGDNNHVFYLNTGSAWERDTTYDSPSPTNFSDGSTQLGDMNGDGLVDLVIARSTKATYLNTGSGWQREPNFDLPSDSEIDFTNNSTQLVDINSDGLADIVVANDSRRRTFLNKGSLSNIWQEDNHFALPEGNFTNHSTRIADVKGRYLTDILINGSSSENKLYLNNQGFIPDLLSKISNGIGGEIQITYKPSTEFDNTAGDGISDLPFPVYVVDTVTTSDTVNPNNPSLVTRYEYKNGLFDFQNREFRGFGYVKVIDAERNYTETCFKQDEIYKGKPYLQETKDKDGNRYTKTVNTWQHAQPYPDVYFPYLAQTDNYTYDADSIFKQTRIGFEYDAYGNPTKVTSQGDVEVSGDEKTQITEYTYNTTDWLLSFPKHTYLLDAQQNKVSEKWFYYDNSTSVDTSPTKGLLTKEEVLLSNPLTTTYNLLPTTYSYDSYGNLTQVTDALGRATTTEYDTLTQSYPVKVTNALGQSANAVYYGINESSSDTITGSGLVGQVKYTQDLNNQKTYNIYDKLGRLIKVIGPNDSQTYPAVSYEYHLPSLTTTNLGLGNGSFETWQTSSNWSSVSEPVGWEYIFGDNFGIEKSNHAFSGDFSVKLRGRNYLCNHNRNDPNFINQVKSKTVTFSAWVECNQSAKAYLSVADTNSTSSSSLPHTGSGCWELLSVTHKFSDNPTFAQFYLWVDTGDDIAYFDEVKISIAPEPTKVVIHQRQVEKTNQELVTYSFYDGLGRLLQTKSPAEADPQTKQPRQIISDIVKFDSRGQIKEKYLPYYLSPTTYDLEQYAVPTYDTLYTSFNYDCLGRLIKVTNPDETSSSVTYSDWVTTSVDENGHSKTQYLDAYGKIIKIEEQNATQTYTTTYQYDTLGNLTQVTDNQNNTTQIWYDSLGRKIKMSDPDMGVWTYEYDLVGNLVKQTDAKAQVLTFEYDVLNRLSAKRSTLNANPVTIAYIYDEVSKTNCIGRLSKVTDSSGSTEFFYDNLGREIKSVKKVGSSEFIVQREYDALDRITKLTYPDNSIVQYAYNPQGIERVYETTKQRDNETTFISNIDYSPTGQIIKIQYGNGTETNYTYDPKTLRLTNLITQSPQGKIQDLNYQFDNVGNITQLTDYVNTATQSFVYDDLDRLTQAQGSYGTLNYIYDSIGNLLNKEGMLLNYGEGSAGPHAVTSYTLNATRYTLTYDANGNMLKKGTSEYTYDIENRLAKVEDKSDEVEESVEIFLSHGWNFFSLPVIPADTKISSVLSSIQGKYDQVSRYNSNTKKFEHFVNNPKFNQFDTFEYARGYQIYITDTQGALLKLTGKLPKTHSLSLKAGYNLISCPKTKEVGIEESLKPLKLGVDYSKIYHYNKDKSLFDTFNSSSKGFTTLKPGESYYIYCLKDTTWNISNTKPTTTFSYDGDGGRVTKVVYREPLTVDRKTTYIGSLYEIERIADSEERIVKHIFAGSQRICSITLNAKRSTLNANYYHSDHLGSSNVITNENGERVGLTEFTPYGTTFKQEGSADLKHKFTGKELDSSTDLYFYGARYYSHELGRFITPDTIVQSPYDPQSLNRYAYCRNNPINYVDPAGHWWFIVAAIIKFAIAHPIIFAGITSALANVAFNAQNITSFASFAQTAAIGFASGAIGAGVGIGTTGFLIGQGVGKGLATFAGVLTGGFAGGFVGGSATALSRGASFGSAMATGALVGGISAGTAAVLYGAAQGINKVVNAIKNGQALQNSGGVKTPVGEQGKGSATSSLNTNKGESASGTQALSSRGKGNVDVIELEPIKVNAKDAALYRQGTFAGESNVKGGQWATENPLTTPDYAQKYGLPLENSGKPDWVVKGHIVGEYGQGPAPASYNNPTNTGGATEIRPNNPNDVKLDWFHMPDE